MVTNGYPPGVYQADVDFAAPHDIDCKCAECSKWWEAFKYERRYEHVTDTAEDARAAAEERGDE